MGLLHGTLDNAFDALRLSVFTLGVLDAKEIDLIHPQLDELLDAPL